MAQHCTQALIFRINSASCISFAYHKPGEKSQRSTRCKAKISQTLPTNTLSPTYHTASITLTHTLFLAARRKGFCRTLPIHFTKSLTTLPTHRLPHKVLTYLPKTTPTLPTTCSLHTPTSPKSYRSLILTQLPTNPTWYKTASVHKLGYYLRFSLRLNKARWSFGSLFPCPIRILRWASVRHRVSILQVFITPPIPIQIETRKNPYEETRQLCAHLPSS